MGMNCSLQCLKWDSAQQLSCPVTPEGFLFPTVPLQCAQKVSSSGQVYSGDGRGVLGFLIIVLFSVFFHNTLLEAPSSSDKMCRVSAVAAAVPGLSLLCCTEELLVKNGNHSCFLVLKLHFIKIKTLC